MIVIPAIDLRGGRGVRLFRGDYEAETVYDEDPVEIAVTSTDVVVRDRGPGIAAEDQPHVFDRFYRSTLARGEPGSGLGLAIVQQIVQRHHGRVWATNRPGGGAEVGFSLAP
jgi:two-component system sensor histidine kinase MprB